jgi:glycosyltransferase involved in cell wall biosynthesis
VATIAMVLEAAFPPDIRVEKEASALADAGHDVHLLALDLTGADAPTRHGAICIHRVRVPRQLHKKLHATLVRWPVYRTLWRRWISDFIDAVRPDVLTVHDLPLASPGLDAGEAIGIPVILDLHENFPAAIESWGFDRGLVGAHLYDLERWRAYERDAVHRAAGVIVVVDEARSRLDAEGVPPERVAVVMNTERPDFATDVAPIDPGGDPPLRLLYIGGFGPHRGIDTAIRAVADPAMGDVRLRIVGGGRIQGTLERLTGELGVGDRVTFVPWVPSEAVPGEIAGCHVGLVPHVRSAHTETTIPHKLFQYMLLERPVLVSDCAPLARIVESTGAGCVFRSGDARDMTDAIATLADPALRRRMGAAGRSAATGPLSWTETARMLVGFYERILGAA